MKTNFNEFENKITLYHGTTEENANKLIEQGWKPNSGIIGANLGQNKYLYLTSIPENALWYAEENGGDVVLEITNIPVSSLDFDPEDGNPDMYDYSIQNAIEYIKTKNRLPVNLILTKELNKSHFKKFNI